RVQNIYETVDVGIRGVECETRTYSHDLVSRLPAGTGGQAGREDHGGAADMPIDLGRVGIWSRELRYNPDGGARAAAAAELEELGYGAICIPDAGGDLLGAVWHLLTATQRTSRATGAPTI